jgi:hypothetical protein
LWGKISLVASLCAWSLNKFVNKCSSITINEKDHRQAEVQLFDPLVPHTVKKPGVLEYNDAEFDFDGVPR